MYPPFKDCGKPQRTIFPHTIEILSLITDHAILSETWFSEGDTWEKH